MSDDYIEPVYPNYIVLAGQQSTHYHAPKWVYSDNLKQFRLSTKCGRDSAAYEITLFNNEDRWKKDKKPCHICFREGE